MQSLKKIKKNICKHVMGLAEKYFYEGQKVGLKRREGCCI